MVWYVRESVDKLQSNMHPCDWKVIYISKIIKLIWPNYYQVIFKVKIAIEAFLVTYMYVAA